LGAAFSSVDPRVLTPSLCGLIPTHKLKPGKSGLEADSLHGQAGLGVKGPTCGGLSGADHQAA
jgi:hypothetical protein